MTPADICPDCKGKKVIALLKSTVACAKCAGLGVLQVYYWAQRDGPACVLVDGEEVAALKANSASGWAIIEPLDENGHFGQRDDMGLPEIVPVVWGKVEILPSREDSPSPVACALHQKRLIERGSSSPKLSRVSRAQIDTAGPAYIDALLCGRRVLPSTSE